MSYEESANLRANKASKVCSIIIIRSIKCIVERRIISIVYLWEKHRGISRCVSLLLIFIRLGTGKTISVEEENTVRVFYEYRIQEFCKLLSFPEKIQVI